LFKFSPADGRGNVLTEQLVKNETCEIMAENQLTDERQALFDINDIPTEFKGVKLDEATRRELSYGQKSPLLRNIELEPGVVKDAKIRLIPNGKNGFKFAADVKENKLVIEPVIHGHKLTPAERHDLETNKVVGPLKLKKFSSEKFFLQVDKELNTVTINTAEGIGIPDQIGQYQLTANDQNTLANGGRMPARVFETDKGYFIANVSLSKDGKGLTYSNIKDLTPEQAKELIPKHNVDKTNTISKLTEATEQAIKPKEKDTAKDLNDQGQTGKEAPNTVTKAVAATTEAASNKKDKVETQNKQQSPNHNLNEEQIKMLQMAEEAKGIARELKENGKPMPEVPTIANTKTDEWIDIINQTASDTNKVYTNNLMRSDEIGPKAKGETLMALKHIENNEVVKLKNRAQYTTELTPANIGAMVENSKLTPAQKSVFEKVFNTKENSKNATKDQANKKSKEQANTKKKKAQKQKQRSKPPKKTLGL